MLNGLSEHKTAVFCIAGITILPVVLRFSLERIRKKRREALQAKTHYGNNFYYHCLFPFDNEPCRRHIWDQESCGDQCGFVHVTTLVNVLSSATKSISLCMYHVTLLQINDELVKAKKRGVNVRIITDPTTYHMDHSRVRVLKEKYKLALRMPSDANTYMHHKFCLIDEDAAHLAKMFFGSLNLTLQGLVANFEYVVVTNDSDIIGRYREEFELLWDRFKNTRITSYY